MQLSQPSFHAMSDVPFKVRVIGRRLKQQEDDGPAEFLARASRLQQSVDVLNPFPKPRGFVFKAKTWEDYAAWRRAQENPRLW